MQRDEGDYTLLKVASRDGNLLGWLAFCVLLKADFGDCASATW